MVYPSRLRRDSIRDATGVTTVPTQARRARLAVGLLFVANGIALTTVLPRLPEIKADLGLTNAALGLALAAAPAGAPAAAFLAHRRSNGRPLQRMVDPQDGAFGGNRSAFASGWRGRAIAVRTAAGEAGSVEPESVALGIDSDSGAVIVERRDAAGRRLTRTVVVPPDPTTDPPPTQ
jgi:hypothetical protein